jgi:hypothetical protein
MVYKLALSESVSATFLPPIREGVLVICPVIARAAIASQDGQDT